MKRLAISIAISALASTAYAGGEKSPILHCGCNEDGSAMVYNDISVSSKSKGHQRHVVGSESTCVTGYEADGTPIVQLFARTGDDCGALEGLSDCAVEVGAVCGEPVPAL